MERKTDKLLSYQGTPVKERLTYNYRNAFKMYSCTEIKLNAVCSGRGSERSQVCGLTTSNIHLLEEERGNGSPHKLSGSSPNINRKMEREKAHSQYRHALTRFCKKGEMERLRSKTVPPGSREKETEQIDHE